MSSMHVNNKIYAAFEDLMESQHSISDNTGFGYHGTIDPEVHYKPNPKNPKSALKGDAINAKLYSAMHQRVRSLTGAHPKVAKHYLDSKHGRHLADIHNDNSTRKLADSHIDTYIKKDFEKFKKHYKPELFEEEMMDKGEGLSEGNKYDGVYHTHKVSVVYKHKNNAVPHERKMKVHAASRKEAEKKAHAHVSKEGHEIIRTLWGGVHEEVVQEMADPGSLKKGDKVIVKHPSSPHNNKRGVYQGVERGRHVVLHSDGTRSLHGNGVLLKEEEQLDELSTDTLRNYAVAASSSMARHASASTDAIHRGDREQVDAHHAKRLKRGAGLVKAVYKMSKDRKAKEMQKEEVLQENTRSADKKPSVARINGKLVTRMIARKTKVVAAGGDPQDEPVRIM